jgi:hypothetical protein
MNMTNKEKAIRSIQELPDDATWEDIQERINFVAGVRKGECVVTRTNADNEAPGLWTRLGTALTAGVAGGVGLLTWRAVGLCGEVFAGLGAELPLATRVLIWLSRLMVPVLVGLALAVGVIVKDSVVQREMERLQINIVALSLSIIALLVTAAILLEPMFKLINKV